MSCGVDIAGFVVERPIRWLHINGMQEDVRTVWCPCPALVQEAIKARITEEIQTPSRD